MEYTSQPQEMTTISARQVHTATVIFVHGLGQSHLTWRMVVAEALAPKLPNVQWLLPQAPRRPVSLNQGQCRPSWFDIARLPPGPNEFDEQAISESITIIESLILSQVHSGIDSRRIILMGFSQGAALSMMVSLTTLHYLGGVVNLSGWIPPKARNQMLHTSSTLPILWCHGTADREIPLTYAEDALGFLRNSMGYPLSTLQFSVYTDLAHGINDEELRDVVLWLHQILG